MLRSSLCDYSDAYILFKGTVTVSNSAAAEAAVNNANRNVIFKNCAPFTSCISRINNTEIYDAKYLDLVTPMYNLIEYNDKYSKTSGILWQYCRDVPALNDDGEFTDFTETNATTESFNHKVKLIGQTGNNGTMVQKMLK